MKKLILNIPEWKEMDGKFSVFFHCFTVTACYIIKEQWKEYLNNLSWKLRDAGKVFFIWYDKPVLLVHLIILCPVLAHLNSTSIKFSVFPFHCFPYPCCVRSWHLSKPPFSRYPFHFSTLKMEAHFFSETSLNFCYTLRRQLSHSREAQTSDALDTADQIVQFSVLGSPAAA